MKEVFKKAWRRGMPIEGEEVGEDGKPRERDFEAWVFDRPEG